MLRFEPFNADGKYTSNWGVIGTHLVVYEPPKLAVLKALDITRVSKLWRSSVPVAAFELSELIVEGNDPRSPNAWNWTTGALNHLKTLNRLGYLVVIFTNKSSMYVTPESNFWMKTAFKTFYGLMERVFSSYQKNVSYECPPFLYAAPDRPSQKKGRRFSPREMHDEYRMPEIGMWTEFEEALKNRIHTSVSVDYSRSYFVGNSVENEEFAVKAGLRYTTEFPYFDENDKPIIVDDDENKDDDDDEEESSSSRDTPQSEVSGNDKLRSSSRQTTPSDEKSDAQ